jgi:Glycosyltransferase like family
MGSRESGSNSLSIVCVFNNTRVREECLDASIKAYDGPYEVEYIPVDNTEHAFATAGAALNDGVRRATHDTVVLVHQDVYLHSIDRLVEASGWLTTDRWGLLGACGIAHDGAVLGRLRDRVLLTGEPAPSPREVDSVDEVLFMVRRDLVLEHPLSEQADLAWHAYGVEYGARLRRMGLRVGAIDAAITHNSLSINLARLDVAHHFVGEHYPEHLPIRTTCGTIGSTRTGLRDVSLVRTHGWRVRWARETARALAISRTVDVPVVLSDIRDQIDLVGPPDIPVHVLNLDRVGGFHEYESAPLDVHRHDRPLTMRSFPDVASLIGALSDVPAEAHVLADVDRQDFSEVVHAPGRPRSWVAGTQSIGDWLLSASSSHHLPELWYRSPARPALRGLRA